VTSFDALPNSHGQGIDENAQGICVQFAVRCVLAGNLSDPAQRGQYFAQNIQNYSGQHGITREEVIANLEKFYRACQINRLLPSQSRNRPVKIHRVPRCDGCNHRIQTAGSIAPIPEGAVADFAQSIEEDRSRKGVFGFSFVEASLDTPAELWIL
jgi:hypothetical protein